MSGSPTKGQKWWQSANEQNWYQLPSFVGSGSRDNSPFVEASWESNSTNWRKRFWINHSWWFSRTRIAYQVAPSNSELWSTWIWMFMVRNGRFFKSLSLNSETCKSLNSIGTQRFKAGSMKGTIGTNGRNELKWCNQTGKSGNMIIMGYDRGACWLNQCECSCNLANQFSLIIFDLPYLDRCAHLVFDKHTQNHYAQGVEFASFKQHCLLFPTSLLPSPKLWYRIIRLSLGVPFFLKLQTSSASSTFESPRR